MFRGILYLVIGLLLLTFVRSVMAMITKAFGELFNTSAGQQPALRFPHCAEIGVDQEGSFGVLLRGFLFQLYRSEQSRRK